MNVFLVMFIYTGSFFHCACIVFKDMKHLERSESTQIISQNDRLSTEIPHKSRANSRIPARVCDVKGGAVCLK